MQHDLELQDNPENEQESQHQDISMEEQQKKPSQQEVLAKTPLKERRQKHKPKSIQNRPIAKSKRPSKCQKLDEDLISSSQT